MASGDKRSYRFKAEVNQVLSLVINSLYSNKEIFLRELISNASDALDKLKFAALTNHELTSDTEPEIRISSDTDAGTLTIADNGIGMDREELRTNLGTVAHSGTQAFMEALQASEGNGDMSLIGQFGVGFYSAFLVADRVEVLTRRAGSDEAWLWESDAQDSYTIKAADRDEQGTSITLHFKEEQKEMLPTWRLRELITRYSDYVSHAVMLKDFKLPDPEEENAEPEQTWVRVNTGKALWQRSKSEVEKEEYEEFYKHLMHDWQPPMAHAHFAVEGTQVFTGLLFVPARAPLDLYSAEHKRGIRLYVKRVFIMDDCHEFIPPWLRFIRGIVDSDDLPLNVSREILQDSRLVRSIQKQLVKKSLDMLDGLAEDKETYETFWGTFGPVLKEGFHYAKDHHERLGKLTRYRSSTSPDAWTSLAEYIERMPEEQEDIYYVISESVTAAAASPQLESLRAQGREILYLTDTVDEWAMIAFKEFDGKKLVNARTADIDLGDTDKAEDESETKQEELKDFLSKVQELLDENVAEVRFSQRLTDSPACLVLPSGGMHAHMERLLQQTERAFQTKKRILELNSKHPIITGLAQLYEAAPESDDFKGWIQTLYDQAWLTEGGQISDPGRLAQSITGLMGEAIQQRLQA